MLAADTRFPRNTMDGEGCTRSRVVSVEANDVRSVSSLPPPQVRELQLRQCHEESTRVPHRLALISWP